MSIQNDETLRLYVEESLEHLADIENDLLAIEEDGADIDEDLVNKVFRAAHSIKGGAGFMGLNNIKELSHKMENVLGMIREREMIPNPEIVNILLLASDSLRNLLNNVDSSNEIDISGHVESLVALTAESLPDEEKEDVSNKVKIAFPDGKPIFEVSQYDISKAIKKGNYIYLVEYDLIHDIHEKDRTPTDYLKKIEEGGAIFECKIDLDTVGGLDSANIENRIPFFVLFATILEPGMVNALFDVEEEKIWELAEDFTLHPVSERPKNEEQILEDVDEAETEAEDVLPESDEVKIQKPENIGEQPSESDKQPQEADKKNVSASTKGSAETSLRVNVSLLDSLMNLAGELVLGRNQLLQAIGQRDIRSIDGTGQRLDLITSELQEAIMMTRMQPIGNVFNKFPRVVRDLARNLGKEVRLTIEGEGVELDKTILEAINDPLTHLIRNSVDHGLEMPENRRKAGKDITGHVLLRAYHEAGQVNIEISDDGKGIDPEKLATAALKKNLITEEQASSMSGKEKINLIFLPGFSTAEQVSDVSGRGVGMDVVKTNLDKLGGIVDIESSVGKGTTIRIKLPLTLAIIPSQLIRVGEERYAIPQVNLEELFRIPAAQVKDRIEKVGDAEVVRLRGNLLPLIRLADVIGVERTYVDPKDKTIKKDRRDNLSDRRSRKSHFFKDKSLEEKGETIGDENENIGDIEPESAEGIGEDKAELNRRHRSEDRRYHAISAVNIVVVYTGALKYGLVVDELHDSEEIVVKPLGRHLKHCKGYAGAAIMGDGRMALILDVAGLSHMANLTSMEESDRAIEVAKEQRVKTKGDFQSLLLFRNAADEQFAVPLGLVERVEKIKRSDIENVGGKKVIQYRGVSLPLMAIEEVANVKPLAEKEELLVVVFSISGRDIGLLATPPLDATEETLEIDDVTLRQPGIMGSAIIGSHTTLMVNIFGLVETLNPDWFEKKETFKDSEGKAATVLYAEDSNFFRNQIKEYLKDEGYNVIEAEDGKVALEMLEKHGDEISLLITDIEMPNLDGFQLAEMVNTDDRFSNIPIIALTTMASDEDIEKGKRVGIDDYQIKLDKEKLLRSVDRYLHDGANR